MSNTNPKYQFIPFTTKNIGRSFGCDLYVVDRHPNCIILTHANRGNRYPEMSKRQIKRYQRQHRVRMEKSA